MTTTDQLTANKDRRRSPVSLGGKIKRLLWSIVQGTLYRGSFHTWSGWCAFLLRTFGAKIGRQCTIRRTSRVYYPWQFEMSDASCLGDDVTVYNLGLVKLGKFVTLSQEAYLCGGTHDYTLREMPLITKPIIIGDDAWVCARAFVGPGVTIGEGGIVAAGAIVHRDVEAWTIVGGNPAKPIKKREKLQ